MRDHSQARPSRPLHLAINGRFLSRPPTGVGRVAEQLLRALLLLRRAGWWDGTLTLLLPAGIDPKDPRLEYLGRLCRRVHGARIARPGALAGLLWEQAELPFAARGRVLLSPCNLGPLLSKRQLLIIHDAQIHALPWAYSRAFRLLYGLVQPVVARRSEWVATVSAHARSELELHKVVPAQKAWVIPNGADHMGRIRADRSVLQRHGLKQKGFLLAIAGQAAHKNLGMLVEAAAARPVGGLPLVIAGGSGDSRVFVMDALPDGQGVHRLGRVSDGELKALYQGALALAFPSLTEGFGLPPLEAMACGTPVVCSTGGALPEVCADAALFADPRDPTAWTEALQRIETDKALCRTLIARGKGRAAAFRWADSAKALLHLLAS
ncbi:MAG: glycosyltransferase family 4 protein [Pikeienuella sp.]